MNQNMCVIPPTLVERYTPFFKHSVKGKQIEDNIIHVIFE